jgi:ABC-type Fe3+/spermidine/putrescine transport system ATPase subunit
MSDLVEGLRFERVSLRFGGKDGVRALRDVSFHVPPGDLVVLVGPSGCGKTTLLRVVAGFETPDEGTVTLDGIDLAPVPPEQRRAAMVFQHYALFPNLTVEGNVGYGPRVQGVPGAGRAALVREMLHLVDLSGFERRRPHELSGGQQQRVALARALAARPRLLLLDEPLSNVDPALRRETRERLRALHGARGVTTLWVTHHRDEALAVADRVVVLRAGEVVQTGTPRELCSAPATPFVAELLLDAVVFRPLEARVALGLEVPGPVAARPERLALVRHDDGALRVVSVSYGPERTEVLAEALLAPSGETFRLRAQLPTDAMTAALRPGVRVRAVVNPADLLRFRA